MDAFPDTFNYTLGIEMLLGFLETEWPITARNRVTKKKASFSWQWNSSDVVQRASLAACSMIFEYKKVLVQLGIQFILSSYQVLLTSGFSLMNIEATKPHAAKTTENQKVTCIASS